MASRSVVNWYLGIAPIALSHGANFLKVKKCYVTRKFIRAGLTAAAMNL